MVEHAVLTSRDVHISVHVPVSCLELRLLQLVSVPQQEPDHEDWNDQDVDGQGISSVRLETFKVRRLSDQHLHLESNGQAHFYV